MIITGCKKLAVELGIGEPTVDLIVQLYMIITGCKTLAVELGIGEPTVDLIVNFT
jgi:DNA-binding CsgD family transcriptional regulator